MSRHALRLLVGLVVAAALLALTTLFVDWRQVGESLAAARLELLPAIAALLLLHYFLKGLRWQVLLSAHVRVPWTLAFRLTMVGFLMNNLIPARVGELARPYLLAANHEKVRFSFALATVVADKLFDLAVILSLLLYAAWALPVGGMLLVGAGVLAAACVLGAAVVAVAWGWRGSQEVSGIRRRLRGLGPHAPRVEAMLESFATGLSVAASTRRTLPALLLSGLSFAALALTVDLTMRMVEIVPSLPVCLLVIGMVGIGFLLPGAPTNVGSFHFFATQAVVLGGVATPEAGLAFAVISHLCQTAIVTLLGAACLVGLDWRKAKDYAEGRRGTEAG